MPKHSGPIYKSPVAKSIPFKPGNCPEVTSKNVQGAIDELCAASAVSASPGFTWGKSGNVGNNTWLLNDTVPSNLTGRTIFLYNAQIEMVYTSNQNNNTYTITIYEHDGSTYTPLTTVTVTSSRSGLNYLSTPVSATRGKELAARITSGSGKNVTCGLLMRGSLTP